MALKKRLRQIFCVQVALILAGCAPSAIPPVSSASESFTTTVTLKSVATHLAYPSAGGFTATFAYGNNNAPAGTTATVVTIVNPQPTLAPMDAPPGTALVAYELTLNHDTTFSVWNGFVSSAVVPQAVSLSGHAVSAYGYDLTIGVASGSDPATIAGSNLSFPAGRPAVTLKANHTYLMILALR